MCSAVNGGEKPWRLAEVGGRSNCVAPRCSVVDLGITREDVIVADFRVIDPDQSGARVPHGANRARTGFRGTLFLPLV